MFDDEAALQVDEELCAQFKATQQVEEVQAAHRKRAAALLDLFISAIKDSVRLEQKMKASDKYADTEQKPWEQPELTPALA